MSAKEKTSGAIQKLQIALGLVNPNPKKAANTAKIIKTLKKVQFVQVTTVDGQVLETDDLTEGNSLYIVDDQGNKSLAPAGTYETDECTIEVDNSGNIAEISEVGEEPADGGDTDEEMKKVVASDVDKGKANDLGTKIPLEDDTTPPASDIASALLEGIKEIIAAIADLKASMGAKPAPVADEEMKKVDNKKFTEVKIPGAKKLPDTDESVAYKFETINEEAIKNDPRKRRTALLLAQAGTDAKGNSVIK
jgi:hypothetical protein